MNLNPACEILVVGGGVAGVPAAVAAARAGNHVVLVEKADFLGGSGVTALHRHICGLYPNGTAEPKDTLNPGLQREIVFKLGMLSSSGQPIQMGRVWALPFKPAHFRVVYESIVSDEQNLTVHFSSKVESLAREGNCITGANVHTPGAFVELHPTAVIDATGSGEIIRLSGAQFELTPESERQLAGCTIHIDNIEGCRELLGVKIAWALSRLPPLQRRNLPLFAGFYPGPGSKSGLCKFSLQAADSRLDEADLAKRLARLHTLLADLLPELAHSRVLAHSPRMDREGIRLAGEWEIDETSLLSARKFTDGVVRSAWPIEFWDPISASPSYAYPPDTDYGEIPRRCLKSRSITNLFASGRCISASSRALAATRVMGTCMALGEAAGREAALLVESKQFSRRVAKQNGDVSGL